MMATHQHDALWEKLHELELQLAAYKLLRAARGDGVDAIVEDGAETPAGSTCRGRQYDAYMRRRDARRVAASAEQQQRKAQQPPAKRTPRLAIVPPAKRTPAVSSSIPSTPRKDGAAALPRSRTVSGGATGSPARPSLHHQRRNSLGVLTEFGECITPRPFLRRGTGTGGAAAPAKLRTTRVHDLPALDVAAITPRLLPQQQQERTQAARRHVRSVSELPFETAALASPSPQARARKRWGSPERPTAMFSGDSHRDNLSKGLKKLLSLVTKKGCRSSGGGGGDQTLPAASPRVSGKPVSKQGWSGCSRVDIPFDRASLDGHRFPMTRAVGISG